MGRKRKCIPTQPGYFWATHVKTGKRLVVEAGYNGFGQFRLFVGRWSRTFGIEEFEDYRGPIRERR